LVEKEEYLKPPVAALYAGHTALQLAQGSIEEGLQVIIFGPRDRLRLYSRFPAIRTRLVEYWGEETLDEIASEGGVIILSGGVVEYLTPRLVLNTRAPVFGLRGLVAWESDWRLKMKLLEEAGLPVPRYFTSIDEVEGLVIAKLPGAKGGRGYIVTRSRRELEEWVNKHLTSGALESGEQVFFQEYVVGTTMYAHYFQSPIMDRLELTGFDVRYETNADAVRRLSPRNVEELRESFVVTGNFPVYPRERLLEDFIEMGERFVEATKRLIPPGVIGPFCLETVVTEDLRPVVFEFSGRIVAGTNVYLGGSPYLALYWGRPLTVGRRVAMEIRMASEQGRMGEVVT
jgi:5-formaminoimidazole-4-carboxamide-1-(beta)-D-ribofuranosyl 5'-monophosphate synthetase